MQSYVIVIFNLILTMHLNRLFSGVSDITFTIENKKYMLDRKHWLVLINVISVGRCYSNEKLGV